MTGCITNAATATGALSEIGFYTGLCISFFTIAFPNKKLKIKGLIFKKKGSVKASKYPRQQDLMEVSRLVTKMVKLVTWQELDSSFLFQ